MCVNGIIIGEKMKISLDIQYYSSDWFFSFCGMLRRVKAIIYDGIAIFTYANLKITFDRRHNVWFVRVLESGALVCLADVDFHIIVSVECPSADC